MISCIFLFEMQFCILAGWLSECNRKNEWRIPSKSVENSKSGGNMSILRGS